MSSRWLLLSDTLLNPLSLHVPSPCVCAVQVWQLGSKTPNFTLEGHEKGVNCIDYYSGGDKPYLISGADDRLVKIWDYQVTERTAYWTELLQAYTLSWLRAFFYLIFHIISNLQSTPTCLITADSVWECHPYVFISLKEHCTVPGRKGNRKHTGTFTHYIELMPNLNWHIKIFASQKHIWPCPSLGSFPNHQPTDLYSQRTDSLRRLLLTCFIIKKCLTKPLVVELCTRLLTPEPRIWLT